MRSPRELVIWHLLPAIRSELVKSLKKEKMLQKDAAKHLGITPAAVSLYVSDKRGKGMELPDDIKLKIRELAKKIISEDMAPFEIMKSICPICVETRKKKILCDIHKKVDNSILDDCNFWEENKECI